MDLFARDEIERAHRYHRPLYLTLGLDVALQLGVLAAIAFGPPGDWLWDATGGPWWARVFELSALVLGVSALVRLPLSCWRGWVHERRWELSTQSLAAWLADALKGLLVGVALTGLGMVALVGSARAWPGSWPAAAAPGAALLALVLGLIAPIVNAPEVAILGATRAAVKPVWNATNAAFDPRLMLPLSLSYDHRVIDGAAAARFVAHLVRVVSDLRRALL